MGSPSEAQGLSPNRRTGVEWRRLLLALLESLPEAKAIVGTGDYQHIVSVLERVEAGERVNQVSANPTFVGDEHLPRYRTTSEAIAYLKVAEGCDYRCAFCIIPHLRGDQRSRTIESIVAEAQQLKAEMYAMHRKMRIGLIGS